MRSFFSIFLLGLAATGFAARLELVTSVPLERARYVGFHGELAWVAQNIEGATLLDVSKPDAPKVVKRFSPEEMQPLYFRILPDENLMVSADRFRGLMIYDISTPDSPTTISATPLPGMTTHLDLAETTDGLRLAVLARAGEGLLCYDITDPAAPRQTDEFTLEVDFTRAVAVADGIVYAADSREGGLKALRLVSPGRFEPLYQADLLGACWSLTVHEGRLLAGYFNHGFRVFALPDVMEGEDIGRPYRARKHLGAGTQGLTLDYQKIAPSAQKRKMNDLVQPTGQTSAPSVQVVTDSDLVQPIDQNSAPSAQFRTGDDLTQQPDSAETTPTLSLVSHVMRNRSMVRDIVPVDDMLVIANEEIGIDLYHVENPALPWLGDEYRFKNKPGMEAQSCAVYGDLVYIPAWEAGLMVFRITDEPAPAEFNLENVNYVVEPED